MQKIELISGRECGDCTACCVYLPIETADLTKLPNIICDNLTDCGKCNIYEKRPNPCREFYCAWRTLLELGDSFRPDLSGVFIEFSYENFPGPFAGKVGFRFNIIDKEKAIKNIALATFLKKQLLNGVPCLLSYGIKEAQNPPVTFLNAAMHNEARESNASALLNALEKAIEACENQPKDILSIENGKIKY